jgi:3-dehydroquinate dehydratase/shikimate dehydrogenase
LREFLGSLKRLGVAGLAVTIPHKEKILGFLDGCDPLAARIGAVNTVVVRGGGRLYGYNTDYVGVLRSLEQRMRLAGSRVLLFGAGGAARAAAFALAQAGSIVCLCARRPERARALARAVGGQVVAREDLKREFFDAILNCTPIGMHPNGGTPLTSAELNCRIVMDMVYRPRETELLRQARRKGIEVISGLEMFLAQGFAQYEIWTGERAPESVMRRAVETTLDREEKSKGRRT